MDKALNMLGLCARAGKLAYGADAAAFSPYLTELRAAMRRDTEEKIAAGK